MIRPSLTRLSRPRSIGGCSFCSPAGSSRSLSTALTTSSCREFLLSAPPFQTRQQRRFSSSESSRPSNGSSDGSSSARPAQAQPSSRPNRRKPRSTGPDSSVDAFSHLPRVAATPHLDLNGVALSSFYSLHRPIQVNSSFIPTDPTSAVDAFFSKGHLRGPFSDPNQVMSTLGNVLKGLGGNTVPLEDAQDGEHALKSMISSHVSRLNPFQPPHPPVPMDVDRSKPFHDLQVQQRQGQQASRNIDSNQDGEKVARNEDDLEDGLGPMTATLVLTEGGDHSGQKVEYTMSIPLDLSDRLDGAELEGRTNFQSGSHLEQPFMRRLLFRALRSITSPYMTNAHSMSSLLLGGDTVRTDPGSSPLGGAVMSPLRHPLWRGRIRPRHRRVQMRLISVKRRRKLKIKKHKYKKLLKRTRTLRRKLDRL